MATPCNKTLRNNDKVLYPLSSVISYRKLSKRQLKYILSISTQTKSRCYEEAKEFPEWVKAMEMEIKALEVNKTWEIMDLPPNKMPIGCKWVYKIKRRANGDIERYKAKLVGKGHTQREGIDYMETYSPVHTKYSGYCFYHGLTSRTVGRKQCFLTW